MASEANKQNNSSVQSGCSNKELPITKEKPPEKSIKEINKANSPKTAPGSVRGSE